MAKEKEFLIGADPEFICVNGGKVVQAGHFVTGDDRFGMDGNGWTFEARPEPSPNPFVLTNNIRKIFLQKLIQDNRFCGYEWLSGSYHPQGVHDVRDFPLGGHIHFGIKKSLIGYKESCQILDSYVGLPTILLEDVNEGLARREDGDYGFASDFREQPYGFEYRTPSSWLSSPYVATGVLCLAKMVMYEVLNNSRFKFLGANYNKEFVNMDTDGLREHFPTIWKSITKMKLYGQYKPYVDLLYRLIKEGKTWNTNRDIKQSWGLFDANALTRQAIPVQVVWHDFLNK